MSFEDTFALLLAGTGLIAAGGALGRLSGPGSALRRLRARRRAASAQPALSPIEDLLTTKKGIREDEASRWVATWMLATGQTDKWECAREIRELFYEGQRRERDRQLAERLARIGRDA